MIRHHNKIFQLLCFLGAAGILLAVAPLVSAIEEDLSLQPDQVDARAEELYLEGIDLFKARHYEEARKKFQNVEEVRNDYKSTGTYLKRSEELIDYNNQRALENERKEWEKQKQEYERDLKMQKRLMTEQTHKIASKGLLAKERDTLNQKEVDRVKTEKQKADKIAQAVAMKEEKLRARDEKRMARLQAIEAEQARKETINEEKHQPKLQTVQDTTQQKQEAIAMTRVAAVDETPPVEKAPVVETPPIVVRAAPLKEKKESDEAVLQKRKEELARKLQKGAQRQQKFNRHESQVAKRRQQQQRDIATGAVNDAYREAVTLIRSAHFANAKDRIATIRPMLEQDGLSVAYCKSMISRLDALEKIVEKRLSQEKEKQAILAEEDRRRQDKLAQQKEVRQGVAKTKSEREAEAKERREEVEKQHRRQQALADLEKKHNEYKKNIEQALARQEKQVNENYDKSRKLIVNHRIEVTRDRNEIKKEFDSGISALYKEAVDLYNSGSLRLADDLFAEIDKLEPDYKLTRQYQQMINLSLGRDRDHPAEGLISARQHRQVIADSLDAFDIK